MGVLKSAQRNKLPSSDFGLPKSRKYPEQDASHARDAESRASEMFNEGRLSGSQKSEIDAKAKRKLGALGSK